MKVAREIAKSHGSHVTMVSDLFCWLLGRSSPATPDWRMQLALLGWWCWLVPTPAPDDVQNSLRNIIDHVCQLHLL